MMKWYRIKEGNHYSFHWPKLYFGNKTEFDIDITLGVGCRYQFYGSDSSDINKLFGVSFGYHHKNSIRIGWNHHTDGRFCLFYYAYNKGIRVDRVIGYCSQHERVNIKIKLNFNKDLVEITSKNFISITSIPIVTRQVSFKFPKFKIGYYLFPYFGGNCKAPHDMNIGIDTNRHKNKIQTVNQK